MQLRTTLGGSRKGQDGKFAMVAIGASEQSCVAYSWLMSLISCFNAFSRVDVRVDVKIPGGVHTYVVDLRGERCVNVGNTSQYNC